jgi:hypothetical protein
MSHRVAVSLIRASRGCNESTTAGSGSVLGQLRGALPMPFGRSDHFHLLPVVSEFVAAIQASHVGSGQSRGLRTGGSANRDGKAKTGVAATEERIH